MEETYEVCPTCGEEPHLGKTCGEVRREWERQELERELRERLDLFNHWYASCAGIIEFEQMHPINSFMSHFG